MNMHIFDNIGSSFSISDSNDFIIGASLPGYKTLDNSHSNVYIPYLARNINNNNIDWEIGVGYVYQSGSSIRVKRETIRSSSNNDNTVDFNKSGSKQFYLFINSSNFNTSFNNVFIKDTDFNIDTIKAVYIVDVSSGLVYGTLPDPATVPNLAIEFRTIGDDGSLVLKDNYDFRVSLSGSNRYTSLLSTGTYWIELKDTAISQKSYRVFSNNDEIQSLSEEPVFSSLSDPSGADRSLQYNNNGSFDDTNIYWGSNDTLLFGASTSGNAKNILPSTGNYPLILNNTKENSDFIVYGSGSGEKNLFFTYDGKLGINIPTGVRPQTIVHIINSSCQESLRVENRSTCYPADVTIYHRPPTAVSSGTVLSQIKLASKDNAGNRIDYVKLQSSAKSTNTSSTKGEFNISVNNGGSNSVKTFVSNPDDTVIGYSGSKITVSNTAINNIIGNSSLNIGTNNISINSANISVSGLLSSSNITISSGLILPNLPSDTLLALNSNKQLSPATGFKLSGVTANKLLTTDSSGVINGALDLDTFLATYGDFTWNKYGSRLASACLRQLTFASGIPAEEFSVGDQIAIVPSSGSTIYRIIDEIDYSDPNTINSILLDQNLVGNYTNIQVHSITKGGYLVNQLKTDAGTISDATSIVLSTRPNTDTVFNSRKKDIDFKVYGMEDAAALSIMANASFRSLNSGVYFGFATHVKTGDGVDIDPFSTQVNANGAGQTSANNSVNFSYASIPFWSGMVTTVGTNGRKSYYGTYDQNGNVFEWVEDNQTESSSTYQNICGGSWRTTTPNGLRSIISTPYSQALDDVGFRICAKYGLNNTTVEDPLNLSFVPVSNIDNLVDDGQVFTESWDNRFGINSQPEPTSILNLGKVYNPYQIGRYEITNNQYIAFLNAVAKTDIYTLYNSNMSSNIVGGITRSGANGSYEYSAKAFMGDKPVVYVDYLSAIRFINWLHNGAPDHTEVSSSTTESGAYTINIAGATTIIKNNDQKYWLPSVNEWHKAAYFLPITTDVNTQSSAVTIRSVFPYEVSSGVAASLTVKDYLYADRLIVGNSGGGGTLLYSSISGLSGNMNLLTEQQITNLRIGPLNTVTIVGNPNWNGVYQSNISNTGIVLASSGNIELVSPNPIRMSGILVDKLLTQSVEIINSNGDIIEGGQYPGPNGGIVYKNLDNTNVSASNTLKMVEVEYTTVDSSGNQIVSTGIFPDLTNVSNLNPVYKNNNGYLSGYENLKLGESVEGIDSECVVISKTSGDMALIVDKIRIGPALPTFSGTILTHNGEDTAYWATADYLKADGMNWSRYPKRALKLTSNNTAEFISRGQSIGGTGPVTAADVFREFAIDETIAIMNASREIVYAKVANFVLIDSEQVVPSDFFTNQSKLMITFCPPVSDNYLANSRVNDVNGELSSNGNLQLAYAHSVQKGGYLDMMINQDATAGFDCDGLSPNSQYRFKPSTANTISIRPKVHTSFNKVAEDIDFAIYGYKDTLYNRYEPSIFATGADGLPSGLNPAFYVNVNVENSVAGSVETGVISSGYLNVNQSLATGIVIDDSAKVTINTKNPYAIVSIPALSGYTNDGKLVVAPLTLTTYADLTVNGYIYGSGLITNNLTLKDTTNRTYIPNAPLTINSLGQLVSLVPPSPATIPDAPTALVGAGGNQSVTLNWTTPSNNGGKPILDYLVEYSDDDGNTWSTFERPTSSETSVIVTGLTNGISYKFRTSAINEVGTGPVSQVSSIIIPTSDAPSQPLNLVVTRGSLQASLSWSAPLLSGSSSIIDYQIDYARVPDPYSDTLEWITFPDSVGTSTSTIVTGILNGPTYYFRVLAKNNSGNGTPTPPVKSVGTDPEPTPPSPDPDPVTDNWDFGEVVFSGVCI